MNVDETLAEIRERIARLEERTNHLSDLVETTLREHRKTIRVVILVLLAIIASQFGLKLI